MIWHIEYTDGYTDENIGRTTQNTGEFMEKRLDF